jgi:hypothetical protein
MGEFLDSTGQGSGVENRQEIEAVTVEEIKTNKCK